MLGGGPPPLARPHTASPRPPGRDSAPLTPAPALSAARTPAPPPAAPPPPTRSSSGSGSGPGRSARAPQALQARSRRHGPLSAPTAPHLLQHGGPRQPHFREPRQRRSRGPGTRTDEAGSLRAWRSRSNSGNPTPLPLPGPQGRSKWGRGDSEWEDPGGAREWAGQGEKPGLRLGPGQVQAGEESKRCCFRDFMVCCLEMLLPPTECHSSSVDVLRAGVGVRGMIP